MRTRLTTLCGVALGIGAMSGCGSQMVSQTSPGMASAGPIKHGDVDCYDLDSHGHRGKKLYHTQSDANGQFQVDLDDNWAQDAGAAHANPNNKGNHYGWYKHHSGPAECVISNGTYVEEATGKTVPLTHEMRLRMSSFAAGQEFAITPLTEIAAARAAALEGSGVDPNTAITSANAAVGKAAGVKDITAPPDDPTVRSANPNSDSAHYALVLAGLSQLAANDHLGTSMDLTMALDSDFADDGAFDGKDSGNSVVVSPTSTTVGVAAPPAATLPSNAWSSQLATSIQTYVSSANNVAGFTFNANQTPVANPTGSSTVVLAAPGSSSSNSVTTTTTTTTTANGSNGGTTTTTTAGSSGSTSAWTSPYAALPGQLGVTGDDVMPSTLRKDASGNTLVAGTTTANLAAASGSSIGNQDFFVMKLGGNGNILWLAQDGVPGYAVTNASATVDGSGNVFVAGTTTGDIQTGKGPALGNEDLFVVKYNSSGLPQWVVEYGVAGNNLTGTAVAVDASGNVVVVGSTTVNMTGSGASVGSEDALVIKLTSGGTPVWVRQEGAPGVATTANGVACDAAGNIDVVGSTGGNLLTGGAAKGSSDDFVMQFNNAGTVDFIHQDGAAGQTTAATAVGVDNHGNIMVTGVTTTNLKNGGASTGSADCFVEKLAQNGNQGWITQLGVSGASTAGLGIAVSAAGNPVVVGFTTGNLVGGAGAATGSQDSFEVQLNGSTGSPSWVAQQGVAGHSSAGEGVDVDSSGNVLCTGNTAGNFATGLDATGSEDGFVTELTSSGAASSTSGLGASSSATAVNTGTNVPVPYAPGPATGGGSGTTTTLNVPVATTPSHP